MLCRCVDGTHKGKRVQIEHQQEFERKILRKEGIGALIQRMERDGGRITMEASNAEV